MDDDGALDALAAIADASNAPRGMRDDARLRSERLAGARRAHALERELEDARNEAGLVAGAWNEVGANSIRTQAPGWKRAKHKDSRSQTSEQVTRNAFEVASPAGPTPTARRTKASTSTLKADALVVCEAMRRRLKHLLFLAVATLIRLCAEAQDENPDYRHPFATISLASDATQHRIYMSKTAAETYSRGSFTKPGGPMICSLLVQAPSIYIPAAALAMCPISTQWITPPYVLQDESAANLCGTLRMSVDPLLEILTPALGFVRYLLLNLAMDSASSNYRSQRVLIEMLKQFLETKTIRLALLYPGYTVAKDTRGISCYVPLLN